MAEIDLKTTVKDFLNIISYLYINYNSNRIENITTPPPSNADGEYNGIIYNVMLDNDKKIVIGKQGQRVVIGNEIINDYALASKDNLDIGVPSGFEDEAEINKNFIYSLVNDRIRCELFFKNVLDQPAFNFQNIQDSTKETPPYASLRTLMLNWYQAQKFLISYQTNDLNTFSWESLDNILKSYGFYMGYDKTIFKDRSIAITFMTSLVPLLKKKGTPDSIYNALLILGFDEIDIYQYYLQSSLNSNLERDVNFLIKRTFANKNDITNGINSYTIDYDTVVNGDSHWLYTKEEIKKLISPKINGEDNPNYNSELAYSLPQIVPYMNIQSICDLTMCSEIFMEVMRVLNDQFEYFCKSSNQDWIKNFERPIYIESINQYVCAVEAYLIFLYSYYKYQDYIEYNQLLTYIQTQYNIDPFTYPSSGVYPTDLHYDQNRLFNFEILYDWCKKVSAYYVEMIQTSDGSIIKNTKGALTPNSTISDPLPGYIKFIFYTPSYFQELYGKRFDSNTSYYISQPVDIRIPNIDKGLYQNTYYLQEIKQEYYKSLIQSSVGLQNQESVMSRNLLYYNGDSFIDPNYNAVLGLTSDQINIPSNVINDYNSVITENSYYYTGDGSVELTDDEKKQTAFRNKQANSLSAINKLYSRLVGNSIFVRNRADPYRILSTQDSINGNDHIVSRWYNLYKSTDASSDMTQQIVTERLGMNYTLLSAVNEKLDSIIYDNEQTQLFIEDIVKSMIQHLSEIMGVYVPGLKQIPNQLLSATLMGIVVNYFKPARVRYMGFQNRFVVGDRSLDGIIVQDNGIKISEITQYSNEKVRLYTKNRDANYIYNDLTMKYLGEDDVYITKTVNDIHIPENKSNTLIPSCLYHKYEKTSTYDALEKKYIITDNRIFVKNSGKIKPNDYIKIVDSFVDNMRTYVTLFVDKVEKTSDGDSLSCTIVPYADQDIYEGFYKERLLCGKTIYKNAYVILNMKISNQQNNLCAVNMKFKNVNGTSVEYMDPSQFDEIQQYRKNVARISDSFYDFIYTNYVDILTGNKLGYNDIKKLFTKNDTTVQTLLYSDCISYSNVSSYDNQIVINNATHNIIYEEQIPAHIIDNDLNDTTCETRVQFFNPSYDIMTNQQIYTKFDPTTVFYNSADDTTPQWSEPASNIYSGQVLSFSNTNNTQNETVYKKIIYIKPSALYKNISQDINDYSNINVNTDDDGYIKSIKITMDNSLSSLDVVVHQIFGNNEYQKVDEQNYRKLQDQSGITIDFQGIDSIWIDDELHDKSCTLDITVYNRYIKIDSEDLKTHELSSGKFVYPNFPFIQIHKLPYFTSKQNLSNSDLYNDFSEKVYPDKIAVKIQNDAQNYYAEDFYVYFGNDLSDDSVYVAYIDVPKDNKYTLYSFVYNTQTNQNDRKLKIENPTNVACMYLQSWNYYIDDYYELNANPNIIITKINQNANYITWCDAVVIDSLQSSTYTDKKAYFVNVKNVTNNVTYNYNNQNSFTSSKKFIIDDYLNISIEQDTTCRYVNTIIENGKINFRYNTNLSDNNNLFGYYPYFENIPIQSKI